MSKIKRTPKVGDIFVIPLGNGSFSFGQIVAEGCYVIYNKSGGVNDYSVEEICNSDVVFFAHTVDVKIEDGEWILIGNLPVPSLNFPKFKVRTPQGDMVTDHEGTILRPATEEEAKELRNLKSYSPVVLERAVQAKFADGQWQSYMDNLLYSSNI